MFSLNSLKDHPHIYLIEQLLPAGSKTEFTLDDLEKEIARNKLKTVTDDVQGIKNFEIMVERLFDGTENKLLDLEKLAKA